MCEVSAGGQVQQDVAEWENAMWQILRSAAERAKANGWTIDAVSMTAQRSSVIAADEKCIRCNRRLCGRTSGQRRFAADWNRKMSGSFPVAVPESTRCLPLQK
ncbi:hypothetical protein LC724_09055 [Blautia sp. RD014234]|nr:hypothetical protein [Blautia parvula]